MYYILRPHFIASLVRSGKNARFLSHLGKAASTEFTVAHPLSFEAEKVAQCLIPKPDNFNSIFYKIRQALRDPMSKIHPFMLICYTRSESPEYYENFGLKFENQTVRIMFTILHVWFIHRGFHKHGLDTRKILIWEYLYVRFRDILVSIETPEHNFERYLVDMQGKTLGFCLALDESFDLYFEKGDPSMLKKMITLYFYNNDQRLRDSENVEKLSFYTIMMESFINKLPKDELKHALFVWLVH
ncbi:uncharacterized protein TA09970 [Theileria annulata]|uniref:Ubiquinol-cytochrome c chaperone domain-containing protein n=1 Tax=Theileria annulata TaxID=5874 RepID=Q4U8Q6_THEAN|nr:uncharacterized protein TA09970 [Theileria annulata]CAI76797.1 hypothetical protein, conserved [Theileria annulata]|eukprot:XP_953422.1 hypothetical protein, conserved [Theileria annulata]